MYIILGVIKSCTPEEMIKCLVYEIETETYELKKQSEKVRFQFFFFFTLTVNVKLNIQILYSNILDRGFKHQLFSDSKFVFSVYSKVLRLSFFFTFFYIDEKVLDS